jgi:hypothetical protein
MRNLQPAAPHHPVVDLSDSRADRTSPAAPDLTNSSWGTHVVTYTTRRGSSGWVENCR